MKQSIKQLQWNLKRLGFITESGAPLAFAAFKNRSTVVKYGKRNKIVFIGVPNSNLFGFYVNNDSDIAVSKEAYNLYTKLVAGNINVYDSKKAQWSTGSIPTAYENLS